MSTLPTGTVTLLFTDIEGSTKLLHELGSETYDEALSEHRRVLRAAFGRHGGVEVDTEGDAFFVAFSRPEGAMAAAAAAQEALASGPIRVRMGLHTGAPHRGREGYIGPDVHKGARIAASAHGGQVVLSKETRDHLSDRFVLVDLGEHRVKDFVELGDAWGIAFSTVMLAGAADEAGDLEGARSQFEASLEAFREIGDQDYTLLLSRNLAGNYWAARDVERARTLHEENLKRARVLGNRELEGDLLGTLGEYALDEGRVEAALPLLRESMVVIREGRNPLEIAIGLRRSARALSSIGQARTAAQLLSFSESLREEVGFSRSWFGKLDEQTVAPVRGQLDEAAFAEAWEKGRNLTVDEAIELALGDQD